ncbi:hypothetical protein MRBLMN1_006261 [Chitinophaga ginsengisegetis]|uniref:ORC-CDC6 family AAA ATPase n=1 Tax=Chitinophaga ginsengisegetis TaxID=393003 RepID=UPI0034427D7A
MRDVDTFYNTYNARHLNPREVAETFIWSSNFEKLIQNNHSVILGARGCGKTTLMKMLTLPALYAWKGNNASFIRKNIPFYSVYISTDIYWDVKNQTYSAQLQYFGKFSEVVSTFSVNSNVFKAICETLKNIIEFELEDLDENKEIELCKYLMKAWKLNSIVPKLEYVVDALNERVDEFNQLIQNVIFNCKTESEIPQKDYFNLSFESSIEYIIPIFERIYGISENKKWALCFDELEFAPLWLQQKLFTSLRSRTQYVLYKLSASPILPMELEKSINKEYGATPGNDVQIIKMWSSSENENFSKEIILSLLRKRNIDEVPESFFGSNDIYNKNPNSYSKGSEFYNEMLELINKDFSFRNFLESYKIDVNDPLPLNSSQKDTIFRKIKPIVYYRNFYIENNKLEKSGKTSLTLRSRKTGDLYSGIEILCKICDGNPRWLIGIINSILAKSTESSADKKIQYAELLSAAKKFSNVIANIPIGLRSSYTLRNIVDKVGNYFSDQLLGSNFNMDPRGTFIVDDDQNDISENIIELLEKGTSQGAFILLDSADDSFDFKIRNKRFKLAYLLSLLYKLPLRKYPATKLSQCLNGIESDTIIQTKLF